MVDTPKSQALEWQHYWRIVAQRKWMLITMCIVSTVGGYFLPYLSADQYEASALILVRPNEEIQLSSQSGGSKELLNAPIGASQSETPGKTYIELARSYTVIERVTRILDLDAQEPVSEDGLLDVLKNRVKDFVKDTVQVLKYGRTFETDSFLETVNAVQEGLDLNTTLETYVFSIGFEADDAEKAADVVNTVAEVFMDYLVELNRSESEAIRTYLKAELERAHEELIVAGRELQAFKDEHGTYSPAAEFQEQLKILSELEVNYEESAATHARSRKKLGINHVDVLGLDAEQKYLASAIDQRKALLKKLPEAEKQFRLLEVRFESALDAHEFLRKQHLEAQIRAARSLPEVVLVARAVPPNNPSKARYAFLASLCLFAALTIGLLLTFLLEFFDTSIRSLEDASLALELPVLATIPPLSNTG